MRYQKVEKIMEELRRRGFDMTTREFFETTLYKILKRHGITEQIDLDEYFELLRQLMDMCAENDLKEMGFVYFEDNDWKHK